MVLGLKKVGKSIQSLGRKTSSGFEGLGRRIEKKATGLGQKIVSGVGKVERIAEMASKEAQPILTGARQAARIGSKVVGAIPGGAGLAAGLELGAQGLSRAAELNKEFRQENLKGKLSNVAGASVAKGLEKFGERQRAIAKASRSVNGFM